MLRSRQENAPRVSGRWRWWRMLVALLIVPVSARAQQWSWTVEMVDPSGKFTSIVADSVGSLHLSYEVNEGAVLKYGFRQAGSSKWNTMVLDEPRNGSFYTRIAVDAEDHPHICYTPGEMRYASWDGSRWYKQTIAPNTGEIRFTCSVVISPDDTPHITWFQSVRLLRYAVLRDGAWLARTLDSSGFAGKWHSTVLDAQGNLHVAYSRFPGGELRYSHWNGTGWELKIVDTPMYRTVGVDRSRGMGNSLVVDPHGEVRISYFDEENLKYAIRRENKWTISLIDQALPAGDWRSRRSTQLSDKQGFPHISYESMGGLKHAYWDGSQWQLQLIARPAGDGLFYNSMTIDRDNTLYISYRDPADGFVKVAVGRMTAPQETTKAAAHATN